MVRIICAAVFLLTLAWGAFAQEPAASVATTTSGAAASTTTSDGVASVTTTDGQTFKNVTVLRVKGDKVLLSYHYSDGGIGAALVALSSLSDATRKALHLRTRDQQAAFEAAQKEKGLVKVGDDWITPEEKKKREEDAAAVKAAAERAAKDKAIAEKRRAVFEGKLTELIPDWKQIAAKPGFQQFLQGKTADSEIAKTNITYGMLYQKAFDKGDAAGAAWVFEEWRDNEKELLKSSLQGVPSTNGGTIGGRGGY